MEEKKKVCVFSLVKNGVVFLFLLWMMVMPVEEIGMMGSMHFLYVSSLFGGVADADSIVFCKIWKLSCKLWTTIIIFLLAISTTIIVMPIQIFRSIWLLSLNAICIST